MLNAHPLVYKLIDALRREQKQMEVALIIIRTVVTYARKPFYVQIDERIKNIVNNYNIDNFNDYFDNLNLIIKY